MGLNETLKTIKFDARLIDWNLKHGLITEAELQAYYLTLPDNSAGAQKIEIDEEDLYILSENTTNSN